MSSSHGGPAAKDNLEPVEYLGTSPSTCPPRRCFHQALVGGSDAWWWMKCPHVKLFSTGISKRKGRRWSWFSVDFPTKHGLNGGAGPCRPPDVAEIRVAPQGLSWKGGGKFLLLKEFWRYEPMLSQYGCGSRIDLDLGIKGIIGFVILSIPTSSNHQFWESISLHGSPRERENYLAST